MEKKTGIKIAGGIAIGRIRIFEKHGNQVSRKKEEDSDSEIARYEKAVKEAVRQLEDLYEKALAKVGETDAELFHAHRMMLEDGEFRESVIHLISGQKVQAEYAVAAVGNRFAEMFENMEDEYFRARSADVRDITERLLAVLTGSEYAVVPGEEPVILAAEELFPSETVQMDKSRILAFVTHCGSVHSHVAILAGAMGIPALAGIEISRDWDGKLGIVDGEAGVLIVDPTIPVLEAIRERNNIQRRGENRNGKQICDRLGSLCRACKKSGCRGSGSSEE